MRTPVIPSAAEAGERLVCTILAAQVAELRDRIDDGASVDLLWRTTDLLSQMSALLIELMQRLPDGELGERCAVAVAAGAEAGRALDELAFAQAQRGDFSRQMAECVVIGLGRLAAAGTATEARLSPDDLAALYVCEEQRKAHTAAIRQFAIDERSSPKDSAVEAVRRAGRRK